MDWLTALSTQDQSFEAQLAKRDLGKKIALLQDIAQQAEQRRQFGQRQSLDERQLTAHIEENKARMAEAQATQDELKRARQIDDERQQVGQYLAAPAGTVFRDPNAVRAMRKAGVSDRLTPEIAGPQPEGAIPSYVLDRQEAQRKADEAASLAKQRERAEAHQTETERIANEQLKLAQHNDKLRGAAADRAAKDAERRQKTLDHQLEQMPPYYREAAREEAHKVVNTMTPNWSWTSGSEDPAEFQKRQHEAIRGVYQKWEDEAVAKHAMKAPGPSPGIPAAPKESSEHIVWRLNGMKGPEPPK